MCARLATLERIAQSLLVPKTAMREATAPMGSAYVILALKVKIAQSSHALTTAATGASASMGNAFVT